MGKFRNFVLGTTALVGLAATTATSALAEGFEIREQSAWGQGASYAGVAAGGSLSSMFWNPATMTHSSLAMNGHARMIRPTPVQKITFSALFIPALRGEHRKYLADAQKEFQSSQCSRLQCKIHFQATEKTPADIRPSKPRQDR